MGLPAIQGRGAVGLGTVQGSGTFEFQDVIVPSTVATVTLFFRTTQPGTLEILRMSPVYGPGRIRMVDVDDASTEWIVKVDTPLWGALRVRFTNLETDRATVSLEVMWS